MVQTWGFVSSTGPRLPHANDAVVQRLGARQVPERGFAWDAWVTHAREPSKFSLITVSKSWSLPGSGKLRDVAAPLVKCKLQGLSPLV